MSERAIRELAETLLTEEEARGTLRVLEGVFKLISVAYFLIVVTHVMTVLGVSPALIIETLRGIAVTLPKYLLAVAPYIRMFYDCYIVVAGLIITALSRVGTVKIPNYVYGIDFTVHMFCGVTSFLITGIWTYGMFVVLALAQIVIVNVLIPYYESRIREVIEFARREGFEVG